MMLRQGLPPIEDPQTSFFFRQYNIAYRYGIKMTPDQTRGILFHNTNSSQNVTYWFNMGANGWTTDTNATAAFSGNVLDCFAGNDYYGYVGKSSSFINAFRWSDHSLITLNKTGLGAVQRCSLHPNGYSLAVVHTTTPYLRVYDLRDGTYISPVTAPAGTGILTCSWTGNGNWLIVQNETAPYVTKYDPTLANRTTIINNTSGYQNNGSFIDGVQNAVGPYSMPHPTKPDCAIMAMANSGQSNYRGLLEVNGTTNTTTDIFILDTANNLGVLGYACDAVENTLYIQVNNGTTKCFQALDLTTYAAKATHDTPMSLVRGQTDESRPTVIVSKNYGQITGTVRDVNNNPVARQVRVFRRSDGLLVGQTTSNATTGDYSVLTPDAASEAYDVQFYTLNGELLNDLVYARVTPALIP